MASCLTCSSFPPMQEGSLAEKGCVTSIRFLICYPLIAPKCLHLLSVHPFSPLRPWPLPGPMPWCGSVYYSVWSPPVTQETWGFLEEVGAPSVCLPPLSSRVLGVWSGPARNKDATRALIWPQDTNAILPSLPPGDALAAWSLDQLPRELGPRAVPRFSAIRLWLISKASCLSCSACCAISSLPTLEVMMKMASLQSMVFPFPSVSRPWEGTVTAWSGSGKAGPLSQELSPEPLCLPLLQQSQHSLLWGL